MFFDSDVAAIESARQGGPPPAIAEAAPSEAPEAEGLPLMSRLPNVYVSAVVDVGDGRWTVWANGYRITPGHQPPRFNVLSVADGTVEIAVPGDDPARFRLHANQTWRSRQRDIVEGIVP
jgi:hypothetical protein